MLHKARPRVSEAFGCGQIQLTPPEHTETRCKAVFTQFLRHKGLTLGLVSTTYRKSLWGLDPKMASSICSSSKQRALKPDSG